MRSGWRVGASAVWLALGALVIVTWALGVRDFHSSGRPADSYFLWDGSSAANVFGMAIIGFLGALVAGGLFGLAWPWRVLGVVAFIPFALIVVVFSLLSADGGAACPDEGGPCSVSAFFRFGGLVVTIGCCAVAGVVAHARSARRR